MKGKREEKASEREEIASRHSTYPSGDRVKVKK